MHRQTRHQKGPTSSVNFLDTVSRLEIHWASFPGSSWPAANYGTPDLQCLIELISGEYYTVVSTNGNSKT
jgi:hypothetical protein